MADRPRVPDGSVTAALGLLVVVAACLAGCGATPKKEAAGAGIPRLRFSYDRARPLGYVVRGVLERRKGIALRDVYYVSDGRRVDGYLVEPEHAKGRPGIVLVHGSGGDRRELVAAAIALGQRGAVALTITEPSANQPLTQGTGVALLTRSRDVIVMDVVAIRRAADLLQSLASVDPRLIGYLGWSAGARVGAFVAASDSRFRALALLSGGAPSLSAYVSAAPARLRDRVRSILGSVDPLRYLGRARPGTLLLEDGTRDTIVPHAALTNFVRAAPRGTTVRWYRAGHGLDAAAYEDAFAWLRRKLRVS